jgi:hypothetical protein
MKSLDFETLRAFAEQKVRVEVLERNPQESAQLIALIKTPEYLTTEQLIDGTNREALEGLLELYRIMAPDQAHRALNQDFDRFGERLSAKIGNTTKLLKFKASVRHAVNFSWLEKYLPEHGFSKGLAVATVFSLLIFAVGMVYTTTQLTPDKLYYSHIKGLPATGYPDGTTMGNPQAPTSTSVDPNSLKEMYRAGNYATVLRVYESQTQPDVEDNFYAGCAYLNEELINAPKAVASLQRSLAQMQETGNDGLEDDAKYFLLFAYLRNNQADEADQLLTEIRADKAFAFRREELNSFWFYLKVKILSIFS